MMYKTIRLVFLFMLLAGCTSPELIREPQPPAGIAPTATPMVFPTHIVTLSNDTAAPVTPTAAGRMVTLKGDGTVNLRSGPGTTYPVVARAASGTQYSAIARSEHGDWLLLASPDFPDGRAWVFTAYTSYDPAFFPLPIATPR